jgi:hypothetical protein
MKVTFINKQISKTILLAVTSIFILQPSMLLAKENIGKPIEVKNPPPRDPHQKAANCRPATAQRDLDINNVRTTILNGGDMWWNLSNARYEIPKVQTGQVAKHSMFAGALWIGGVTSGNLRIAGQTYRQGGNDYYPGPLTIGAASITEERCKEFDRIWKLTLQEIDAFRNNPDAKDNPIEDIRTWPQGLPALGEERNIAPFFDNNNDNIYNPSEGDFPSFEQNSVRNIPDMMLFILYNDKGNIHSETEGIPIGLELQTTAFGYATNDEINNMTFYRNIVINRGNETIDSCVFGQWVDPDLGNYADDYVECDVTLNLGICYNGDDNDEGILGYGLNPPSVGVVFFEGPIRPDSTEIGLTKFVYYNNDFSVQGNPTRPEHYWGYLNGRWKDGAPITYGGNGKGGSAQDTASFMFPGDTDPAGRTTWTERTAGNAPADRRFLQTAGPFSLLPGARNKVTIGVVWARASTGGATGSFNLLKQASRKAQILFKNNFNIIAGPDAPTAELVELNKRIIINLTNTGVVEGFVDSFAGDCSSRSIFKFQGYQIFQLKRPNIPNDIYDQDEARLVAQFDVKDGIGRLVNQIYNPDLEEDFKKIMVEGEDEGIKRSIEISKDLFETGTDQELVNFKNYHFLVIAYAAVQNCANEKTQYLPGRRTIGKRDLVVYSATPHDQSAKNNGTKINAKYGDGFVITQTEGVGNGGANMELSSESVAELMNPAKGYLALNRKYIQGRGPINVKVIDPVKLPNAEFHVYIRDLDTIVNSNKNDSMRAASSKWYIRNMNSGELYVGTGNINKDNEELITKWGLSIDIRQPIMPGDESNLDDIQNGFITSSITFSNPANDWLTGVSDEDPNFSSIPYGAGVTLAPQFNWIRSGSFNGPKEAGQNRYSNGEIDDFAKVWLSATAPPPMDPRRHYSNIINGRWAPYALASRWRTNSPTKFPTFGPAWDRQIGTLGSGVASDDNQLHDLYSVNIVFTSDRSKWTRCVVVETGEYSNLNQGGVEKMDLRRAASVDKYGRKLGDPGAINDPTNPEAANYIADSSMGWFPGYAYNIETGERLNLLFGEDSSLPGENGGDMLWNPTSSILDFRTARPLFGGKHYVYVMSSNKKFAFGSGASATSFINTKYDAGKNYRCIMEPTCTDAVNSVINPSYLLRKRMLYSQVMWTSMAMLSTGSKFKSISEGLIPSDVTIRIRVKRPYANFFAGGTSRNDSMPYFTFSTQGVAPELSKEFGKKALDNVGIVPNPYYAYSSYEDPGNQLSNVVRLVNLPPRCTIRIYTMDGVLVRTIRKDDPNAPYLEWNIRNDSNVPISSGMYLIHVNAPDLGEERIIKWFAIMRPSDFDTF